MPTVQVSRKDRFFLSQRVSPREHLLDLRHGDDVPDEDAFPSNSCDYQSYQTASSLTLHTIYESLLRLPSHDQPEPAMFDLILRGRFPATCPGDVQTEKGSPSDGFVPKVCGVQARRRSVDGCFGTRQGACARVRLNRDARFDCDA